MQHNVCELRGTEHVDGITTEIFEKLRSKKKAQRNQTEADRWKDIFRLLFPGEIIPSPCEFFLSSRDHPLESTTHSLLF
jgi:hypothetical protein